MTLKSNQND